MVRIAPRIFVGVILGCIGCGGGQEGPETADVTGYVSLAGAPLAGADVFFHPVVVEGPAQACQAVTGDDGRFTVETHVDAGNYKPGMVPGDYRVSISKLDTSKVTSAFTPPKNILPPKYASPQTSGFTVTVSADKPNNFEFPLDDKG
jgi:hypothetical protein